jgi:hypothetical protein
MPEFPRLCPLAFCLIQFVSTQKICQLEPEGRVKVDLVLRTAEALLACCHDDQKPEILARLRDIKAQWEETVTYMTHCHR